MIDLLPKAYPSSFGDYIIHNEFMARDLERVNDVRALGFVSIPYVIIFETIHTLRRYLIKTRPIKGAQKRSQCVYKISCECWKCLLVK